MSLSPEARGRISSLLEREARTDGSAAQDLREFEACLEQLEAEHECERPQCDVCFDRLHADEPVVCRSCFRKASEGARARA